jgi:hypothetical protein
MGCRPRDRRDLDRARRASEAARAQGRTATDVALAQIGAAFDEAARINAFKLRVEHWLRLGPNHSASRARFGARAEMLRGRSLDAAIVLAERWWRAERQAFAIASALGRGNALSLEVLSELRLILRLLRFKHLHAEFDSLLAALGDEPIGMAAE